MLNVICLVGRMVHSPELKRTNSGNEVTTFTVAVERSRSGQDGQRQVDYIDVIAWRKTAEFICKYFQKGSWIAVNGTLQTRTFEDRDSKKRKVYEVLADNVHFAGSKATSDSSGYNESATSFDDLGDGDEDVPF
ncbi:single-stranded DNA-binding protein [Anaerotignum sp.]